MVSVVGLYENGQVKLDKNVISDMPVKVIVTFLEEVKTESKSILSLSDFSFRQSQKNLENYKGSLGDAVIAERRKEV